MLEATYKKGGVFKYPKILHYDNWSKFKCEMAKLLQQNIPIVMLLKE